MKLIFLLFVFGFYFTHVHCGTISGCPAYGCRPTGTFSYLIQLPPKEPKVIWNTTYNAIANCLGCVGNINNIVCLYNGPKSDGYVSIDSGTGKQQWYATAVHHPSLPIMDIEGDIIGTDGHNMVKYQADGTQVKPSLPVSPLLYPLYSPQLADNGILLFASMSGILFSMDTAGIPHASISLNGTVERYNGTFIPVTTPIIVGTRAFILTEFKPDYLTPESRQPHILGMQRLYAIDIVLRMTDRLHLAWIFDFEIMGRTEKYQYGQTHLDKDGVEKDNTLRFRPKQFVQGDPLLMADVQTETIYVILPPPELNSNMPRLFWAIKDGDNNATLLYKSTISAARMSMYEINGLSKPKPFRFASQFGLKTHKKLQIKRTSKKRLTVEIPVWLLAENRNLIYKLTPSNGAIKSTFNLTSMLNGQVKVTSDIMVSRQSDTSMDNVLFGVSVSLTNNKTTNYVVCVDASGNILWKVPTPMNAAVTGQIAGIASEGANSNDDMLVAFGITNRTSVVFGIQ